MPFIHPGNAGFPEIHFTSAANALDNAGSRGSDPFGHSIALVREAAMPAQLSVNLNAVAMLRNRRDLPWPSVTGLGRIALANGAHGLTVHPRPDQRHIRFSDLPELRALIDDEFPQAEFNIEGYPTVEFLDLVEANQPEQVTLVPDDPSQATSDHGWDFEGKGNFLRSVVQRLKKGGARVSLFCDPDATRAALEAASATGADRVEFYTGPYGGTYDDPARAKEELAKLEASGRLAAGLGLGINAGHDLTVANLPALARALPNLLEVSIGHGLTADALEHGMAETVRRFVRACG
jgi:pyridoxine 5-phosphate synthase